MLIILRLLGIWRFSQLGNPEQTLQKVSHYSIILHKLTIVASSHSIEKKKATSLEEDAPPTKKKKRKDSDLFSKSDRILPIDPELTLKTLLPMKDPTKPDGKAVNADGSLKPADEIKWLNSPSDELRPSILGPDEDMGDISGHIAPAKMQEQKKSHISLYESNGHIKEDSPFSVIHIW